jgi:hypothetical protein
MFTPDVAQHMVAFRVDASTQARIDALAEKCTEGQLTAAEGEEYDTYLMAIDFITVLQAKARTVLDHRGFCRKFCSEGHAGGSCPCLCGD